MRNNDYVTVRRIVPGYYSTGRFNIQRIREPFCTAWHIFECGTKRDLCYSFPTFDKAKQMVFKLHGVYFWNGKPYTLEQLASKIQIGSVIEDLEFLDTDFIRVIEDTPFIDINFITKTRICYSDAPAYIEIHVDPAFFADTIGAPFFVTEEFIRDLKYPWNFSTVDKIRNHHEDYSPQWFLHEYSCFDPAICNYLADNYNVVPYRGLVK